MTKNNADNGKSHQCWARVVRQMTDNLVTDVKRRAKSKPDGESRQIHATNVSFINTEKPLLINC